MNKKIIIFICIIILFTINSTCIYGAQKNDSTEIVVKNIQKITNGADVKLSSSETNINQFNISINTKGLDKGYYTTYLYENEKRDWSNYEAVAFDIENESDDTIRINLNIKESDVTLALTSDNNIVLAKKDNAEVMEIIHPSYGTIEIPKRFKGTIYIPFNSLKEQDKAKGDDIKAISKISSWGITVTLSENQETDFILSKFSLINKGSDISRYANLNFSIKGDNSVEIPVAGESISDYKIESNGKETLNNYNVKFKLKEPIDGITLSDNGRLTLATTDIEPQKIQMCAILDEKVSVAMDIELVKSWTLGAKEVDGTSKSIPKAGEVAQIISNENNILMNKNVLIGIRVTIVLIALGFGTLYWSWKKQKK